MGSIIQGFRLP